MDLNHNRFFIFSGILSFSFFALIVLIIGWQVSLPLTPSSFAVTQSDVISISLDSPEVNVLESISDASESQPNLQHVVEEIPKKSAEHTVEKTSKKEEVKSEEVAISDLFSTVKTSKSVPKVKDDGKRLSELNALEEKVFATKRESKLFEKAKSVDLAKVGVKLSAVSGSSGPVVNEYKAKIQGIVYTNFNPKVGTEGFSARVRITLSPDGKLLSYRVMSYSGNSVFNAEVDWLKERLGHVILPSNPNGNEGIFEIILTAKD